MRAFWPMCLAGLLLLSSLPSIAQDKPPTHFISEFSADLPAFMAYIATDSEGVTALYVGGPGRNTPIKMEGSEALAPVRPRGELPFCWTPDGARVTFLTRGTGEMTVWAADRDSGRARSIVSWKGTWFGPKWSADGARLAVCGSGSEGAVCRIVSADGRGDAVVPGAQAFVWSPTSDKLACLTPGGVTIYDVLTNTSSVLAGSEGRTGRAVWSHDGQLIALEGVRPDGAKGVVVARPSAGTSAVVGPDLVDLKLIATHPSRDEVLAAGIGADGGRRLYRFAPPWREGEDLTACVDPTFVMPSDVEDLTDLAGYTPGGDEVLVVASAPDSRLTRYLYAIPTTGAPRCLSEPVGVQDFACEPSGGDRLLFTGRRTSTGRLSQVMFVCSRSQGAYKQLAQNVLASDWAPNGTAVAYISRVSSSKELALAVLALPGGEPIWVTNSTIGAQWCPR